MQIYASVLCLLILERWVSCGVSRSALGHMAVVNVYWSTSALISMVGVTLKGSWNLPRQLAGSS